MQGGRKISEEKPDPASLEKQRRQLIEEIKRKRQSLSLFEQKIRQTQQRHQKVVESNHRNEKRLGKYRNRIEQLHKFKDNPQYMLQLGGYMNEYVQAFMISHNYVAEQNFQNPNTDNMSYEQLIELGERIGKVSKGLSKEEIDKLVHLKNREKEESCPICVTELKYDQLVIKLNCKHIYHQECILEWLKDENTCPICKQHVIEGESSKMEIQL